MTIALILDLVVIALLIATIAYCFMLNRRLDGLRDAQAEMRKLTDDFGRATERARAGIADLKAAQGEAGEALQANMTKARQMLDELSIMTQSADRLAGRLDQAIDDRRRDAPPPAFGRSEPLPDDGMAEHPADDDDYSAESGLRSAAERELMQALRRAK